MIASEFQTVDNFTPLHTTNMRAYSRNHSQVSAKSFPPKTSDTLSVAFRFSTSASRSIGVAIAEHLNNRLLLIQELKYDWDGYGGIVPNTATLRQSKAFISGLHWRVLQFLKAEDITPTPYGTIVMDFYRGANRLSIEFGETKIGFFTDFVDATKNIESEGVKFEITKLPNELEKAIASFLQVKKTISCDY